MKRKHDTRGRTHSIVIQLVENRSVFVFDFLVFAAQLLDSLFDRWQTGRDPLRIDAALLQFLGVRLLLVEVEIQTFLDVQPIVAVLVGVCLVCVVQPKDFVDDARLLWVDLEETQRDSIIYLLFLVRKQ